MLRHLVEQGSVAEIIAAVIAFGLIAASILSLVYIIIGGISFILSAGNEERIKNAVRTVRYAIIGLIVSFVAFFAVAAVAKLLDIPFDLSFGTITQVMNVIFDSLR